MPSCFRRLAIRNLLALVPNDPDSKPNPCLGRFRCPTCNEEAYQFADETRSDFNIRFNSIKERGRYSDMLVQALGGKGRHSSDSDVAGRASTMLRSCCRCLACGLVKAQGKEERGGGVIGIRYEDTMAREAPAERGVVRGGNERIGDERDRAVRDEDESDGDEKDEVWDVQNANGSLRDGGGVGVNYSYKIGRRSDGASSAVWV